MLFIQVSLMFLLGNVCVFMTCVQISFIYVFMQVQSLKWTARHHKYHLDHKEKGIDQMN